MKHTSLLIMPLLLVSWGSMAQMTYEEAVESNADYYAASDAANQAPNNSALGPDELQDAATGELNTDVLYLKPNGKSIGSLGLQISFV